MVYRKKLIEVALPLEAINKASSEEKNIKIGKPTGVHLWWARRPLSAARAIIFSQLVDDPSEYVDELLADHGLRKEAENTLQKKLILNPLNKTNLEDILVDLERERIFHILEELILWENTSNKKVIENARIEIVRSWRRTCAINKNHPQASELYNPTKMPSFVDPFAGGGAIPLEAQRLGLRSYASDLNPVAVLINKAILEIPPILSGKQPINPNSHKQPGLLTSRWLGLNGLAEDIEYYSQWMLKEAKNRICDLYPDIEISTEMAEDRPDLKKHIGKKFTVIAWIWARTVKSPNPAFSTVDVPLASTFMLSTKTGKEAYVEPIKYQDGYKFFVKTGKPKDYVKAKQGTKPGGSGASFECIMSGIPIPFDYIRSEAKEGRMGAKLMAIVAQGDNGRIYLSPSVSQETLALQAMPDDYPEVKLPDKALGFRVQEYGMTRWCDLFTSRQLIALTTFSDLVVDAHKKIYQDAVSSGIKINEDLLDANKLSASNYADAITLYLALAVSRSADWLNSLTRWLPHLDKAQQLFSRHAIPMGWDYVEINPLTSIGGGFEASIKNIIQTFSRQPSATVDCLPGVVNQIDVREINPLHPVIFSTDPPYYDNIGYADLSDFFYLWLRKSMRSVFPDLFATVTVPKDGELIATPFRHGNKDNAERFFLDGMTQAMNRLSEHAHPSFPVTIYYAFKQSESEGDSGIASTGWETFIEAVIRAGFAILGTWPIRTEMKARQIAVGTNALASSIVIVCRKKDEKAITATRRDFINALKNDLPGALNELQRGNIAPVDLAQASIGPGMAIYTRYASVIDAKGNSLSVREALTLINQVLDEVLTEQEGDFDSDTRWALAWFEHFGFSIGEFGTAETLSKAKDTSVVGMVEAGIVSASHGKVRLLRPAELANDWNPLTDKRLTTWETLHQLIRTLESGGENSASDLMASLGYKAEPARELCYRLYAICDRKKWATEALSYNALVQSWPEITRLAREISSRQPTQGELF